MITTITTTTTTVVAAVAFGAALGAVASAILILLLAAKEIASADGRPWTRALSKALNIGIWPLLLSFALIVIAKVLEVLI